MTGQKQEQLPARALALADTGIELSPEEKFELAIELALENRMDWGDVLLLKRLRVDPNWAKVN